MKLQAEDNALPQERDAAPAEWLPETDTMRIIPRKVWILGAGHFGQIAARRLLRRAPEASLLVVDTQRERLGELEASLGLATLAEDAMSFLQRQPLSDDQWIIPAIPIHVALRWLVSALEGKGRASIVPVPTEVDALVPNPYRVACGTLYASYASFRCPDACSEPDRLCTHTHQPRLGNLFEHLAALQLPGVAVEVIRSWQLAPGVGGYPGIQLREVLQRLEQRPGRFLIATSCRCHAVIDGLEVGAA
jgi:hypothetical protein